MAVTNSGFDGTVTESQFAKMFAYSTPDVVGGDTHWKVTQGSGRQVSIAAGDAFAAGVLSTSDAAQTLALATPTNGQWHLIVRRITWSTNTVTVASIPHTTTTTTTPTLAPSTYPVYNANAGTLYDQPLAWAWVNSVNTTVTVLDLRLVQFRDVPVQELTGFNTGWSHTDVATDPASVSVFGKNLSTTGRVSKTAGAGTTVAILPLGLRPERLEIFTTPTNTSGNVTVWIYPTGSIELIGSAGLAIAGISLAHTMRVA